MENKLEKIVLITSLTCIGAGLITNTAIMVPGILGISGYMGKRIYDHTPEYYTKRSSIYLATKKEKRNRNV